MKLNLGCGPDYREGWINVDVGNCKKDVDHDLTNLPLPFENNYASYILLQQVIEHIQRSSFLDFMRELHRISKPGALIHLSTPYFSHKNAWTDFTHVNWFTEDSFGYFDRSSHLRELGIIYGIDFTFKVKVYPVDENGIIRFDLIVEK